MEHRIKRFSFGTESIFRNFNKFMDRNNDGAIKLSKYDSSGIFISSKFDSSQKGMKWGRVAIKADFPEDCEYRIYAMVSDHLDFNYKGRSIKYDDFFRSEDIPIIDKIALLTDERNSIIKSNVKDILLLGLEGRYLWFGMEILHTSEEIKIEKISIYFPADSLLKYFPEIYRKNKDDFFERYLSIFSSMNKDYQKLVEDASHLIDIKTAPDSVVKILASWLGINIKGEFLSDDQFRILVKNSKYLNQYKGTVGVISKVIELFIGEKPIIVEQIKIKKYNLQENYTLYQQLYGANNNEFLIMLNKDLTEKLFYQLKLLVNYFKPFRTKFSIIFLSQEMKIDGHCYIGINSILTKNPVAILTPDYYLDGDVILAK